MKKCILIVLTALICTAASAQIRVTGKVTDSSDGSPISYAHVYVKGNTSIATSTDDLGNYILDRVPSDAVIVFTFIGYETLEVPVNGRSVINASLKSDAVGLDEVLVVAYGSVKKGSYSGSATMVKDDKIRNIPVASFEQTLAGNVAGMQVSANSGVPGALPQIMVRGVGSFNAGTQPLYVIDGVPTISGDHSDGNATVNSMSYLNPNDIESITVLKDAAASSLYGSRASNGVILITTKKGQAGKAISTFRASAGFSYFAYDNYPTVGEEDHVQLTYEAIFNHAVNNPKSTWQSGGYSTPEAYATDRVPVYFPDKKEGYVYKNWEDVLFRTGITQNYEFSVSGGSETARVFASVAYMDMQGVYVLENLNKITATINAEQKLLKNRLTVGANFQYGISDHTGHQEGQTWDNPFWGWKTQLIDRYAVYTPDGSWNLETLPSGGGYKNSVANHEKQITESKQYKTVLKGTADLKIIDGLNLKSIISYDNLRMDGRFGWMVGHPNGLAYGRGYMGDKYNRVEKVVSSTTLNFNKSFGDHNIAAMIGWEVEKHDQKYTYLSKADFANEALQASEIAASVTGSGTYWDADRLLSALSSVSYSYANKYFITGTYRRDGSSRLSPEKRWGDFWSVSGSWRISQENFLRDASWLNDLRLRASHGTSGILPSSWYGWQSLYSYWTYGDSNASYPSNLANTDLTWERGINSNIALEATIFDRFSIVAEWYNRLNVDLLMNASIPSTTGFTSQLRNVGSMKNTGVEITLNYNVINKKDIGLDLGFNWATNKNEIIEMSSEGEELVSRPFLRKAGYSYYQFYSRERAYVDPETGELWYYKNSTNADGTLDKTLVKRASANSTILEGKTALPKGFGGFNVAFRWKNLSASLNFAYKYGHYVFDEAAFSIDNDGYNMYRNISTAQLDRWTTPGQITDIPRRYLGNTNGGSYDSDYAVKKADYLRLKSANISYSLPQAWMKSIGMVGGKVYVAGTNLLTFSGLNFDPETRLNGYANFYMPAMRTISLGVELSF